MVKPNLVTIVIVLVDLTFSHPTPPIQNVISKIFLKTEKHEFKIDHFFLDFTFTST